MAQKNKEGTLSKKLLPEISSETHQKVSTFLKERFKFDKEIEDETWTAITLWTTNIAFILYEHVELHKGMGGYSREDAISLSDLRDFMIVEMKNGAPVSSVILAVLSNCFNAAMHQYSDKYYDFIHPRAGGNSPCYPGGPNTRWNKHIFH